MDSLQELVDVTSVDSNVVRESVALQSKDFEDALQFNSAKIAGMDCIVTRNIKDFASFDMEVMTPGEFLMLIRNME